jgi:hypothetical protein
MGDKRRVTRLRLQKGWLCRYGNMGDRSCVCVSCRHLVGVRTAETIGGGQERKVSLKFGGCLEKSELVT